MPATSLLLIKLGSDAKPGSVWSLNELWSVVSRQQVLCLECVCFREIISVSFLHSSVRRYVRSDTLVEEKELPFFKTINWYVFA